MRSSRRATIAALVLGVLAVAVLPLAIIAAQVSDSLPLLRTLYVAVPISCLLALAGFGAERKARAARARQVQPTGARLGKLARVVVYVGLYAALTAALALGVYGILRWAQ